MSMRDEAQEQAGELLEEVSPERVRSLLMEASVDLETAASDPTAVDPESGDRTVLVSTKGEQRVISWSLFLEALRQEVGRS